MATRYFISKTGWPITGNELQLLEEKTNYIWIFEVQEFVIGKCNCENMNMIIQRCEKNILNYVIYQDKGYTCCCHISYGQYTNSEHKQKTGCCGLTRLCPQHSVICDFSAATLMQPLNNRNKSPLGFRIIMPTRSLPRSCRLT